MRQREIQKDTESDSASVYNFYSPIRLLKTLGEGRVKPPQENCWVKFCKIFEGVGKGVKPLKEWLGWVS
jgi:hypothetical protein